MRLEDHPTVKEYLQKSSSKNSTEQKNELEAQWLKELVLDAGADDVGLVDIERPILDDSRQEIVSLFPEARTAICVVGRINPANIRCVSRSVAETEFIMGFHAVNNTMRRVTNKLRAQGTRALFFSSGFPMEMEQWPGKMWPIAHKPLAEEAGLGKMGHHRLVIHPRFGNFIILGTLLIDRPVSEYDQPLDFEPCLLCKLCVAACPVGAIGKNGSFNFANCMTHNYRDRMGGFIDWIEKVASSKNSLDYRKKVSDPETVSMWQSLAYGFCNKSSYCMAVCPAGSEVVGLYIDDKKGHVAKVLRPLQQKDEYIFVVPGTDAEEHVAKHYPHKKITRISNGLRPKSISNFLDALGLIFQPGQSKGLKAVYHFTFTGEEQVQATVDIHDQQLFVSEGHDGTPDIKITADSKTWIRFLAKEIGILRGLLSGGIRIKGSPSLMKDFAKCFPS